MKKFLLICIAFCTSPLWSQNQWHVRPYTDNYTNPSGADGTSFATAWCLQFALSGAGGAIQPGDTVWLHGDPKATYNGVPTSAAVYKGHFTSSLLGTETDYIIVKSYPGEWAVIDGNVHNHPINQNPNIGGNSPIFILHVVGGNVRFENFEITCLGDFSRIKDERRVTAENPNLLCEPSNPPAYNFHEYTGIEHNGTGGNPIRNEFRNLVFRNIPGVALASWKFTTDSEIYGNIFYNNGIINVTGVGCGTPLEEVSLTLENTRGHQTCIYTQNVSDVDRIIRNNIFLNCYDSALNIWSSTNGDLVRNYVVSKNVFINNGSPVRDETANMIVSANAGTIENIDIDSNTFYINSRTSYISGITVTNTDNISMTNNYFFNGTACMDAAQSVRNLRFNHNFYSGKHIKVMISAADYKSSIRGPWSMDFNVYFTRQPIQKMFQIPIEGFIPLTSFSGTSTVPHDSTKFFRSSNWYNDELHSTRRSLESGGAGLPPQRTIINQNRYNPNKFYVTIYNPLAEFSTITSTAVNFSDYGIPNGKHYVIRDVQNLFVPLTDSIYDAGSGDIDFPTPSSSNFEPALPITDITTYGSAHITQPAHSNSDLNTYIIEFDCSELAYDVVRSGVNDSGTTTYEAENQITFGTDYTTEDNSNITAIAKNKILIVDGAWIKSGSKFLGRISTDTCSILLNTGLETASFNTNPDDLPPTLEDEVSDEEVSESRAFNSNIENASSKYIDNIFKIYPNPSTGIFNIESSRTNGITKVRISNANSSLLVFDHEYLNEPKVSIDISQEMKGLYIIQVELKDGSTKTRTIAKK